MPEEAWLPKSRLRFGPRIDYEAGRPSNQVGDGLVARKWPEKLRDELIRLGTLAALAARCFTRSEERPRAKHGRKVLLRYPDGWVSFPKEVGGL